MEDWDAEIANDPFPSGCYLPADGVLPAGYYQIDYVDEGLEDEGFGNDDELQ